VSRSWKNNNILWQSKERILNEHLLSRAITERITDKEFEIGDRKFLVVGKVQ
jgi:hypothetical protein